MKGSKTESSVGDDTQYFGFLPQESIGKMQSPDYDKRIESSQEILDYVPTIPIDDIDVPQFLRFIQEYITDANLKVAQNCSLIVEEIISATKETGSVPVHQCIGISFDQLKDKRRFVIQLGVAVIGDLLRATDPSSVLSEIVKQSSTAPANLQTQIFRSFTTLITQKILDPELLLDYAFYFDAALTSPVDNIKQAALWCVDFLKANHPSTSDSLLNKLSQAAARTVGRVATHNPATAIPKNRTVGPQIIRPINTAGVVEAAKLTMAMSTSGGYRRPALPSAGARRLFSLSRPISSTFANSLDIEKPIEKFNFEPVQLPPPEYEGEKYQAPPEPDHDDEVLFGDLPEIDSRPVINTIFEAELESEETKPKVGHTHFENAVFEEAKPKVKNVPPKQPSRVLRSKLHKEFDELQIQGNFGGSHFDESAFNEIAPLAKPKSKAPSSISEHTGSGRDNEPKRFLPKRNIQTISNDLPASLEPDLPHETKAKSSAFGAEFPESLEIVATKPKAKSVKFGEIPRSTNSSRNQFDLDSRPISTSGAYNFGDDAIADDDIIMPKATLKTTKPKRPPKKILTVKPKTPQAPATANKEKKPPATPSTQTLIENLQSDDWEVQNSSIENLMKTYTKDAVKPSLRSAMTSLLECAQSTRTTLAKNALNLVLTWIDDKEIPVSGVSEVMATRLLKLLQQQSSHHFIAELAGKCFIALLDNITENKIATIVTREMKSPFAQARAMVANGVYLSMKKIEDPTPFLVPLANLSKDADQNARKWAKLAVKEIAAKKGNFAEYVKANVASHEDQNTLIKLSTAP